MSVVTVALAASAGCGVSQLQFKNDHRLSFTSPQERARVTLPVTVRWQMRDFDLVGLNGTTSAGKGVFAVFVDQAPMPVGKDLKWLARDEAGCARDPRCPGEEFLTGRDVHITTDPSLTLEVLPSASDGVGDEQHYVNVVLLDGTGRRIGESAWYLPFSTKRR